MFVTKEYLEEVVDKFVNAITALTRANIETTKCIFELSRSVEILTERIKNIETSSVISVDLDDEQIN